MVCNRLDEFVVIVVPCALVLQIRVCVRAETFCVVKLHMCLICSQHVERDQVHDGLLPRVRARMVQVLHARLVILFNAMQSAFVCHVSLANDERHRIHLHEYEIWSVRSHSLHKEMLDMLLSACGFWNFWHTV